jgi:hypothetical protein
VEKPIGAVCMEAKISILGLKWDNIIAISTWTAESYALAKDIRIQLFAGYGEDGYNNIIFDGSIIYAMPTMPPNIWINIIAISGAWRSRSVFDKDFGLDTDKPVPFREYLKILCNFIGDSSPNMSKLTIPETYENLPYFGRGSNMQDVFDEIVNACKRHNAIVYEDIDADGNSHFTFENAIDDKDFVKDRAVLTEAKELHTISAKNGMIGIPRVTFAEIEVTKFLDTSLNRGGFLYLETEFAPGDVVSGGSYSSQNGYYRINNIRHHGHLRGQEWYSTFKAYRWDDNYAGGEKKFGE